MLVLCKSEDATIVVGKREYQVGVCQGNGCNRVDEISVLSLRIAEKFFACWQVIEQMIYDDVRAVGHTDGCVFELLTVFEY